MDNVVVGIHQPNFFPWFGYFLKIARSDKFVFLDDAQISYSSSYVNRTVLNFNSKVKWLTAPVQRIHGQNKINKTNYLDTNWRKKIINTLQMNYGNTPHYKENKEFINDLILYPSNLISDYNIHLITEICHVLNLSTPLYFSSAFAINKTSTERLIEIVKFVNGNIYLSGSGGDNYQDLNLFNKFDIELLYNEFEHPEYKQFKTNTFLSGLSILDMIFNLGIKSTASIISIT